MSMILRVMEVSSLCEWVCALIEFLREIDLAARVQIMEIFADSSPSPSLPWHTIPTISVSIWATAHEDAAMGT
jgi:hypothetical protein